MTALLTEARRAWLVDAARGHVAAGSAVYTLNEATALLAEIDDMAGQRDRARDVAAALEQQTALVLALHPRQEDEDGMPVCLECWPKVTPTAIGQLYVPWPCPTAQAVLPPAEVRQATPDGAG